MKKSLLFGLLVFLLSSTMALAQTGKISGRVTDAETGEPLPGVNVILLETEMGAATDTDGFYSIINVPAGAYDMQASFIGYAAMRVEGVRVNINLTTTQNFELQPQAIAGQEVVVEAQAPVVKPDISANIANVTSEEIEQVPVAGVTEFINLQAGIEPGMSIRGGSLDEVAFVVDGLNTRSGRDDTPFTGVSYTSVSEFQVQTGGFNAEYGNVRSGLVNIVTKEGPRNNYTAELFLRYTPAQKKYFGISPDDPNALWMRPYLDPEVAWDGTESGAWDRYTQDSYPSFNGWNAASETVLSDDNPDNDMTPEQAQELYLWRHRKDFEPTIPDYQVDGSFGGPVPFISNLLGNLRFFGSYRQTQKAYIVSQMRDRYWDQTGQLKLTSDISSNMKLMVEGTMAQQYGVNAFGWETEGGTAMFQGEMPKYPWQNSSSMLALRMDEDGGGEYQQPFLLHRWNPMDVDRNFVAAKFTHTFNPNSLYEIQLQRHYVDYFTRPGRERDYSPVQFFGTYGADEAPYGWTPGGQGQDFDPVFDMRMGAHIGLARDSSDVATWDGRFDLTSQLSRFSQLKTGAQFTYRSYNSVHGKYDPFFVNGPNPKTIWDGDLSQGAVYVQNKLEFEGMVANVGVRMDYYTSPSEFYVYDNDSLRYDVAFSRLYGKGNLGQRLPVETIDPQFFLSPRLGISYPITANSKLFFNYGHFRQLLEGQQLLGVRYRYDTEVAQIGNPYHEMPRTVSYELGYEHNLFNQFLLRLTGYYKAIDEQSRSVSYTNIDGQVNYSTWRPWNYEDIRGFEVTFNKNLGRWIRGFLNYTYLVRKSGDFGYDQYYENDFDQSNYERTYNANYQSTPIPEPFARFNITFLTPRDFGPSFAGIQLLSNWRLNLLGEYRSGQVFTWTGGGGSIPGLSNNVKWKDYYMFDVRLAKEVFVGDMARVQLFMDVDNLFNFKYLYRYAGFTEMKFDWQNYMQSLHLPDDTFDDIDSDPYLFIPGDDRPGDYRKTGIDFQPVEVVNTLPESGPEQGRETAWYYRTSDQSYNQWSNGSWSEVGRSDVNQVLDDKAYINMPNETTFSFLNPRQVFFGIRVWF